MRLLPVILQLTVAIHALGPPSNLLNASWSQVGLCLAADVYSLHRIQGPMQHFHNVTSADFYLAGCATMASQNCKNPVCLLDGVNCHLHGKIVRVTHLLGLVLKAEFCM